MRFRLTICFLTLAMVFCFAQTASAAITLRPPLNLGLVGYWSMEEGTGTKAGDMSGNGNTASFPVSSVETFTTSGAGSWQAPAGVTSVQVEAWGGGGNGATDSDGSGNEGGGGGGGGAYAKLNSYSVTPGNSYSYYVGGAVVASYWINSSTLNAIAGTSATGISGGGGGNFASCTGDVKTSGNDGGDGTSEYWCEWDDYCGGSGCCVNEGWADKGGDGGSGATAAGGQGGAGAYSWNPGSPGSQPGGGGGGGDPNGGPGAGAPGQIVLTYGGTPPTWTDGKRGRALSFNGVGDYISAGNVGSGIKTISFWLKADDTTSRKIMDFDGTDQIELNGSSQITATSFPGTTIIYVDGAVASTVDSNWHLVTITDTTGVNGSAVDIGRVASGYFDGMIDEVRFYNRVLSSTEVTSLYNSGAAKFLAPNNTGLVGYWSMDEGTGTKAGDFSGNGKTGTIYSNAVETFTTSGAGSWQAPAGVTSVQVELWGGGGGGAYGNECGGGGGGGGANALKNSYSVSPGNSYAIYVGGEFEDSYFINASTVRAAHGEYGDGGWPCNGGGGGLEVNSVGDYIQGGSPGGGGDGDNGGSGGGSGGSGGVYGYETGQDGFAPGGGGGGGFLTFEGGAGAPGQIILTYAGAGATWADGKRGKALSFNGTGDYISAGNVGSGIKTISFWLKADDTTSRKIMDFDGTDQIELNGSSQITATSFPGTTIIYVDGTVASTVDSSWHLVTITDTTGVNGSAVDIGRVASGYFDGMIDEVRMYNRVLSSTEVANLYTSSGKKTTINSSQNSQLTSGLVGLWSFNGPDVNMTTNTAYDRAGSNNGTISGATPAIGKVGQGMSFNGSNHYVSTGLNIDQSSGHTATFCAWVNPSSTSASYHSVVSTDNGGSDWTLERNGAYWGVMDGNGHSASTLSADANTWQHICAVYDSGSTIFYKNASAETMESEVATALSIDVGAGADNGLISTYDNIWVSIQYLQIGGHSEYWEEAWIYYSFHTTLRFLNITIPRNATINSALVTLHNAGGTRAGLGSNIIIRGDDVDNSGALSGSHCEQGSGGGLSSTAATVNWDPGSTTINTPEVTSDIKTIIAEITSRAGWSSGNAITLGLDGSNFGQSENDFYSFYAYDYGTPAYYPQLDISYMSLESIPPGYDTSDNNVSIGRNPSGSEYFDGKIDEVRAYDRALTAAEIQQLYNMGR